MTAVTYEVFNITERKKSEKEKRITAEVKKQRINKIRRRRITEKKTVKKTVKIKKNKIRKTIKMKQTEKIIIKKT